MAHWDTYWRLAANGDCFSRNGQSFLTSEFEAHWNDIFAQTPSHSRVLDLACGNGFVGKLTLQNIQGVQCIGVDASSVHDGISVADEVNKGKLSIIGNSPMETLEFPDQHFDLIVSQFGFEYGNEDKTLPLLGKFLNSSGRVNLVIHHSSSALTAMSRLELKLINYLLNESGLMSLLGDLLGKFCDHAMLTSNDFTEEMRELNSVVEKCYQVADGNIDLVNGLLVNIFTLIEKYSTVGVLGKKGSCGKDMDTLTKLFESRQAILTSQVQVAKSEFQIHQLSQQFHSFGFNGPIVAPMVNGEQVLAWTLTATKQKM